MTKQGSTAGPSGRRAARAERLAAALKANLRRRKTQARGRAAEPSLPEQNAGPEANADASSIGPGRTQPIKPSAQGS